jgi:hypothetical protein
MGRRSLLQRTHSAKNLEKLLHDPDKENSCPNSSAKIISTIDGLSSKLKLSMEHGFDIKKRHDNEHRQLIRAQDSMAGLREQLKLQNDQHLMQSHETTKKLLSTELELTQSQKLLGRVTDRIVKLQKKSNALRKRRDRAAQKTKAVEKAVEKTCIAAGSQVHHLKEKGVVPESSRALVREFVHLNIPVENINKTIQSVSHTLGVVVDGTLSKRTASRIIREGGIAAKLQIVHEIENVNGA